MRRHQKMWKNVEMFQNQRNLPTINIPSPPGYWVSSSLWSVVQLFSRSFSPSGCNRQMVTYLNSATTSTSTLYPHILDSLRVHYD